jgi:hypothetical protein
MSFSLSAVSLGLLLDPGTAYDPSHAWTTPDGQSFASVRFDLGATSWASIQGPPPAALRELADALHAAADAGDARHAATALAAWQLAAPLTAPRDLAGVGR